MSLRLTEREARALAKDAGKPRRQAKAKPRVPTEHEEQCELIRWADEQAAKRPEFGLLFAIPNASGYRGGFKANKFRVHDAMRQGLRPGVPDLFWPIKRGGYAGLFIEMKRVRGSSASKAQMKWLDLLSQQGYWISLNLGAASAKATMEWYWSLDATEQTED